MTNKLHLSRRQFLQASLASAAGLPSFPTIVPSSVLGADAPSKKIQIGQIGCGRIAHDMDMPGILKHDIARIVAVCDLDSKRLQHAKTYVEGDLCQEDGSDKAVAVKTYGDYRELLKNARWMPSPSAPRTIGTPSRSSPPRWPARISTSRNRSP